MSESLHSDVTVFLPSSVIGGSDVLLFRLPWKTGEDNKTLSWKMGEVEDMFPLGSLWVWSSSTSRTVDLQNKNEVFHYFKSEIFQYNTLQYSNMTYTMQYKYFYNKI